MDVVVASSEPTSLLFSQATLPGRRLRVSIILPVRNEASHLTDTVTALANQTDGDGNSLESDLYEVLLLTNNCTDDSAAIARHCQQLFPALNLHVEDVILPPGKNTIGALRRMLMDEACKRLSTAGGNNGIIASTDGDTIVDTQWVYQIIKEIDNGSDAVGGRILTPPFNHAVRRYYLRDVMYRTLLAQAEAVSDPPGHDTWPKHFQYFGANFAVTCKAYLQAGRLPPVAYLEDVAFYQALLLIDAKVRRSSDVKVYTSARLRGKVEVGFSEQLQKWNDMARRNVVQTVEPTATSLLRYENRSLFRRCRNSFLQNKAGTEQLQEAAAKFSLCPHWLTNTLQTRPYFGQVWQAVERKTKEMNPVDRTEQIPITQAIYELRVFLHGCRKG